MLCGQPARNGGRLLTSVRADDLWLDHDLHSSSAVISVCLEKRSLVCLLATEFGVLSLVNSLARCKIDFIGGFVLAHADRVTLTQLGVLQMGGQFAPEFSFDFSCVFLGLVFGYTLNEKGQRDKIKHVFCRALQ